jgi:hypothetical protein
MSRAAEIAGLSRNLATFVASFAVAFCALAAINAAADEFADFFFLTHWKPPRVRSFDDRTDVRFKAALVRAAGVDGLDAAIFGSSRVMSIDPATPEFQELAPRALNLGIQGARLGTTRQFLDFVARRDPHCLAVVGLDLFAFNEGALESSIFLDEANPLPAWRDCLGRLGSYRTVAESWDMLHGERVRNALRANGLAIRERRDPAEVEAMLARFAETGWRQWPHFQNFRYDPGKIEVLRAMQRRFPRVVFFTNPASRQFYEGQARAGLAPVHERWLADLGQLGNVIDFSRATEITDQPRRFYDMHHYDTAAGAMILRDVAAYLQGRPLRCGRLLTAAPPAE